MEFSLDVPADDLCSDKSPSPREGGNSQVKSVKSSQVKYALFRHKQIHVSRPHMGDMTSEKCITSTT